MRVRGILFSLLLVAGAPRPGQAQILPINGCGGFAGGAVARCGFSLGGAHLSIAGLMTVDPTQYPLQENVSIQIAMYHTISTGPELLLICSADGMRITGCSNYTNDPTLRFGERIECIVRGSEVGYFRCSSALPSP